MTQSTQLARVRDYVLIAYLAESRRLERLDDWCASTDKLQAYRAALALLDRLDRTPAAPSYRRLGWLAASLQAIDQWRTRRALRAYVRTL